MDGGRSQASTCLLLAPACGVLPSKKQALEKIGYGTKKQKVLMGEHLPVWGCQPVLVEPMCHTDVLATMGRQRWAGNDGPATMGVSAYAAAGSASSSESSTSACIHLLSGHLSKKHSTAAPNEMAAKI